MARCAPWPKACAAPRAASAAAWNRSATSSCCIYEGRELDIVTQAETVEPWRPLHEDLARLADGMAMAEAAEQVAQEREAAVPLYRMLVAALRALVKRPGPLVVAGFYWKLLSLDGAAPVLSECAGCGSGPPEVPLVAFDMREGGALCRECRRGLPLSPAALEVLGWILEASWAGRSSCRRAPRPARWPASPPSLGAPPRTPAACIAYFGVLVVP